MKISIAMATYNGAKYILKQLDTLRKQTRPADEVVICDDQSKDDTVALVKQFITEHQLVNWQILINEQNLGFVKNFKKALSLTTGDIIFLADQDDEWMPDKLAKMATIMEQHLEVQALSSCWQTIDGESKAFKPAKTLDFQRLMEGRPANTLTHIESARVLYENHSPGCTMVVTRSLCDEYLQQPLDIPHDWGLNVVATKYDGVYVWGEELISYRIHANNTIGLGQKRKRIWADKLHGNIKNLEDLRFRLLTYPCQNKFLEQDLRCIDTRIKFYQEQSLKSYYLAWQSSRQEVSPWLMDNYINNWTDFRDICLLHRGKL